MEILKETIEKNIKVEEEVTKAVYTPKDIEELIIKDIKEKGYSVKETHFYCEIRYESDSWGMSSSSSTIPYLDKVVAIIEGTEG